MQQTPIQRRIEQTVTRGVGFDKLEHKIPSKLFFMFQAKEEYVMQQPEYLKAHLYSLEYKTQRRGSLEGLALLSEMSRDIYSMYQHRIGTAGLINLNERMKRKLRKYTLKRQNNLKKSERRYLEIARNSANLNAVISILNENIENRLETNLPFLSISSYLESQEKFQEEK